MRLILAILLLLGLASTLSAQCPVGVSNAWTCLNRPGDGSNGEQEVYTPANYSLVPGGLILTETNTPVRSATGTYFSADKPSGAFISCTGSGNPGSYNCLSTYSGGFIQWTAFNQQYGEFQIRAKLASGWPAIWMEGSNCQVSNVTSPDNIGTCNWNSAGSQELDIAEGNTVTPGGAGSTSVLQNFIGSSGGTCNPCTASGLTDITANFHTYAVRVTSSTVTWLIDGVQTNTTSVTALADNWVLFINTAIGGGRGGNPTTYTYPNSTTVAWVKVCSANCANGTTAAPASNGTFWDDFGTQHFILAGAAGTASGNDWTNACTDFTGSCSVANLVRGDTYYVGTGSYAGRTFNTPTSGVLPITIKGATVASHGAGAGWSNPFGVDVTQATFTGSVTFNTSFWTFDGSVGPVFSRTPSQYGFAFSSMTKPLFIFNTGVAMSDVTVAHVAATAPAGDVEKFFISTDNASKSVSNVTISNIYGNGWQNMYWATSAGLTMDNWVFQYCMCLNQFSSAANHGEYINNNFGAMTNQITRWNWFEGSTGGTGVIVANNNNNTNAQIYGNVFNNITEGNGIITGTSAGNLVSPQVYNNTFIGNSGGGWIGSNVTGSPIVRNNLLYNQSANGGAPGGDYNAYFSTSSNPSEAHGQIASGNPFVNLAGNNVHLLAATTNGLTLVPPWNIDVDGVTRGGDGVWDRGAYEFVQGTGTPTVSLSPTSLAFGNQPLNITSSPQNVTLTNTGTATLTIASITLTGANPTNYAISSNPCGGSLGAGLNCIIGVTFTPSAVGSRTANLTFTTNASSSPDNVSLTGTGQAPVSSFSPTSATFNGIKVGLSSSPVAITLTNTGNATMSITSITLTGANPSDYSSNTTCGATLTVSSSCAINVTFSPLLQGLRGANISVVSNTVTSPDLVPLTGIGFNPISGAGTLSGTGTIKVQP